MANTFSITALELVNRVNRRRRMNDVGDISHVEDYATLNAINTSMEDVLTSRDWDFDDRHDGQLILEPKLETAKVGISGATFSPATTVTFTDTVAFTHKFVDDRVARLVFSEQESYADTGFRLKNVALYGPILMTAELHNGLSFTATTEDCVVYWSEYILPDTVAAVTRVRHQEETLTLEQVSPQFEYDEIFPRPQVEYGEPEIVSVGGFDRGSYRTPVSTPPPPGLRLMVWPVPDEAYSIDYSYRYRHPELTTATSVLEGVTPEVVSQIVDMAAADMKIFYENDYDALALRRAIREDGMEKFANHSPSRSARRPIGNWDGSANRSNSRGRDPFGGKLLGGS